MCCAASLLFSSWPFFATEEVDSISDVILENGQLFDWQRLPRIWKIICCLVWYLIGNCVASRTVILDLALLSSDRGDKLIGTKLDSAGS